MTAAAGTNRRRRALGSPLERVAAAAVAAIAAATFATSFQALTALAHETAATPPPLAVMLPVALDGMIVAASMAVVAARRAGRSAGYSWALVGLYTSLSVAGNAVHAAARGPVAAVVAAAFPLTLFLSFEQLLRITATARADGREAPPQAGRSSPEEPPAESAVSSAQAADAETDSRTGEGTGASARQRVAAVWDAHTRRGGDPAALTGPTVAATAGCSTRRAQELLAELRAGAREVAAGARAPQTSATAPGTAARSDGGSAPEARS